MLSFRHGGIIALGFSSCFCMSLYDGLTWAEGRDLKMLSSRALQPTETNPFWGGSDLCRGRILGVTGAWLFFKEFQMNLRLSIEDGCNISLCSVYVL